MRTLKPRLLKFFSGILLLLIVGTKNIEFIYAYQTSTGSVEVSSGHVVPVQSHGKTIYLTESQVDRQSMLHWSNFVLVGAAVVWVLSIGKTGHADKRDVT